MNAARRANIGEPCRHVDGVPPKVKAELAPANHSSDDGADVEPAAQVPASRRSSCRLDQCKRAGKRRHDRIRVRQQQTARREEGITDRLDLLQPVSDGEVLERLRNEHHGEGDTEELDARNAELSKRLAAKQAEKDRYVRAYAQGHISEDELGAYLADVKDQLDNLRRLLDSVEGELSQKREQADIADSTEAWLHALRGRVEDVEDGSKEAFRTRRQLVRLLVAEATIGKMLENGQTEVRITYRFGPPPSASDADYPSEGSVFGDHLKNGSLS